MPARRLKFSEQIFILPKAMFRKEVIQESLWVNNMSSAISPILSTAFIAILLLALAVDLGCFTNRRAPPHCARRLRGASSEFYPC